MTSICPNCGYNFEADAPLELGDWRIVPRVGVFYQGKQVSKRESWTQIMLVVAGARGALVNTDALLNRKNFEAAGFTWAADTTSVLAGHPRILMRRDLS